MDGNDFDLKAAGRGLFVSVLVVGLAASSGCGSDTTGHAGTGAAGAGGYPATGGVPAVPTAPVAPPPTGTGGFPTGEGGSVSDLPERLPPICDVHEGEPLLDVETFDRCEDPSIPACSDGRCIPRGLVPEESRDQLAPCDDDDVCVPEHFIETNGDFLLDVCRSLNGAEGRCLSFCIPAVASQADLLPQSVCAETELCAPCYDPRTGEETGACRQGCDGGPSEPPVLFDKCCGGVGSCVDTEMVPEDDRDMLSADTCTGSDQLCAPDKLAESSYVPPTCRSLLDAEGRCLPACLPAIQAQADMLPSEGCDDGELCAPCFDPVTGEPTGACSRGGDEPEEEPVLFEKCCGGAGSCVPTDILSEDQRGQLQAETCEDEDVLCAPDVFASASVTAPTCRSVADAEGRCLPTCLPDIAAQADVLPRSTCADEELCAPCFDPFTGEDTGACTQGGDAPAEPPYTFPRCCGAHQIGVCVPSDLVPEEQRSQLGQDVCPEAGMLCAPEKMANDDSYVPPTCRSLGDAEGRCLPECLPDIQSQADMLPQRDCDPGELCAPCYNPVSGEPTGACELNGDTPKEDPYLFPKCCPTADESTTRGTCIPTEALSPSQADSLPQDSCEDDSRCVPDLKAHDPNAKFPSCGNLLLPGACVPDCLSVPLGSQGSCEDEELCAPCDVPLLGPTGACD